MIYTMQHAHEHIMQNMEMLKLGLEMRELSLNTHVLDDQDQKVNMVVLSKAWACAMNGH